MDGHIFQFFVVARAGWLNRHQTAQFAYLTEENRVLRQHLGKRRLLLTDAQRRRLAAEAKAVGRRGLLQLSTVIAPDTYEIRLSDGRVRRGRTDDRGRLYYDELPSGLYELVLTRVDGEQWGLVGT